MIVSTEKGSVMIDYVLVLVGLLAAFITVAAALHWLAHDRTSRSMNVVEDAAPCGPGSHLSGNECM